MKKLSLILLTLLVLQGCSSTPVSQNTENDDPGASVRAESPNEYPNDLVK